MHLFSKNGVYNMMCISLISFLFLEIDAGFREFVYLQTVQTDYPNDSIVLSKTSDLTVLGCGNECSLASSCVAFLFESGYCSLLDWFVPQTSGHSPMLTYYERVPGSLVGKYAEQSSDKNSVRLRAEHALDGTGFVDDKCLTATHTALDDSWPWWFVDLGETQKIIKIGITVAKANQHCDRFHDMYILTGYTREHITQTCNYYKGPPTPKELILIDCPRMMTGRFVMIKRALIGKPQPYLELCDVIIWAF